MELVYLLIALIRSAAGDINASFINTADLPQCRKKELFFKAVFSSCRIPVPAGRCICSKLQFTEFSHALSSRMARHFYRVSLGDATTEIRVMPDWQGCMQQQDPGQDPVYCSSSIQSLVNQPAH